MQERLLLVGPAGSGKTAALMDRYRGLVQAGARTDQILVLVADAGQAHAWRRELGLAQAGPQEIYSYFGFAQKEVRLRWAQVERALPAGLPAAEPVFLNVETSHYLMRRLVNEAQAAGRLTEVVAGPQRIAVLMASNLWTVAAANGIPAHEVGRRLTEAAGGEDEALYRQVQATLDEYRQRLLAGRLFDYGLLLETYHRTLLTDPAYVAGLVQRFPHVLVDDLDETVPLEHAFLQTLLPALASAWLAFSTDGGHTQFMGARPQPAYATFRRLCPEEWLERSHTCGAACGGLGDALAARIQGDRAARAPAGCRVERIEADLRGEMAQKLGERAAELIRDGVPPHEIGVVAPQVDKVLLHQLGEALAPAGARVEDLSRTHRLLDDPFARALVTVVELVHPEWGLAPGPGALAGAFAVLLELDPMRAFALAGAVARAQGSLPDLEAAGLRRRIGFRAGELYDGLREWVAQARHLPRPIDELVAAAASELLAPFAHGPVELTPARQLVRSAQRMRSLVEHLGHLLVQPAGQCYVEMLLAGTIAADPLEQPGQDPQAVPVATPYAWLSSRRTVRFQLWADASGDAWYRSDVKELTNPHVLSPDWQPGDVWTDTRGLKVRRANAARTVRALLRRCREGLVAAESTLDSWGREQEGGVSDALRDVLGGGQA